MDRMVLEAYPHRIIEGLAIAAYAVGATRGVFYIRHEYQLAVQRVREAIAQAESRGLLGENLFGTDFGLRFEVKCGAGAFVCGEETALMASVEGRRGMPRFRPPYPSESGLWGCPTSINNVETLGNLPWIFRNGPEAFAAMGTATSKGTKVFALAGRVRRGGLIEVPMGMTLWQIVMDIGGGIPGNGRFKAIQIGGPSGGCIPAHLADTPVDYEALSRTGAIMGSGGLIVMDQTNCMVDMARYFLEFTQKESCGRCTFCRVGTRRMLETLERICQGKGKNSDLANLEDLSHHICNTSLCGLGKTAPNPVLTTLKYFRDEYEAHLAGRCPAGRCPDLIRYDITDACIGCTICSQECPVDAIPLTPHARHIIDDALCVRCGICKAVCPERAVRIVTGRPGEETAVEEVAAEELR
jgi:NADH-quinone oxidoreductase subunit F